MDGLRSLIAAINLRLKVEMLQAQEAERSMRVGAGNDEALNPESYEHVTIAPTLKLTTGGAL